MRYPLPQAALDYIDQHLEEYIELIKTLVQIPSPSNHEEKRAAFIKEWLENNGCKGVYIDDACNVVFPYQCDDDKQVVAFLAHTDTVFPDDHIPMRVEGDRIYAPGIGDDTACVAGLMLIARFLAQENYPTPYGILLVGNSGEEGLGNLRGSKKIVKDYGKRMYNFIAVDGGMPHVSVDCVGSQRYKITIKTEGGHSYGDFGNRNAIRYMASLIDSLYSVKPPQEKKTTYNVGVINGGVSINTICPEVSALFDFRSPSRECLAEMLTCFESILDTYSKMPGVTLEKEILAVRPCKGDVDPEKQQELWDRCIEIIKAHDDTEIKMDVPSCDANIPWSEGIASTTIGMLITGANHTYDEWIEISSLKKGLTVGLNTVLSYCII